MRSGDRGWRICRNPLFFIGAASRTRTEDRLITNQMLYQLS